jgi:hypothetical protein
MSELDESEIDRFIRLELLPVPDDTVAYWKTRPVEERLNRLEALREAYIQTLPPEQRVFQKVCRVIQRQRNVEQDGAKSS